MARPQANLTSTPPHILPPIPYSGKRRAAIPDPHPISVRPEKTAPRSIPPPKGRRSQIDYKYPRHTCIAARWRVRPRVADAVLHDIALREATPPDDVTGTAWLAVDAGAEFDNSIIRYFLLLFCGERKIKATLRAAGGGWGSSALDAC